MAAFRAVRTLNAQQRAASALQVEHHLLAKGIIRLDLQGLGGRAGWAELGWGRVGGWGVVTGRGGGVTVVGRAGAAGRGPGAFAAGVRVS